MFFLTCFQKNTEHYVLRFMCGKNNTPCGKLQEKNTGKMQSGKNLPFHPRYGKNIVCG